MKMDILENAIKRALPGVLVVDHRKNPVFVGPGVARHLENLSDSEPFFLEKPAKIVIPKRISRLLDCLEADYLRGQNDPAANSGCQTVFIPGKQSLYCCRGFFLSSREGSPNSMFHMMVLIEKFSERYDSCLDRLKQQYRLTRRQMEIVKLLLNGAGNKEIAQKLFISEDTVKVHLKYVMSRLQVGSRVGILSLICKIIDPPARSSKTDRLKFG